MSEVLSNDRVAELVASAMSGGAQADAQSAPKTRRRVREIDFSRPTKFTKEQQRRIERAHEGYCRSASLRLSGELRAEIELEVLNLAQVTLSGATSQLPGGVVWAVLRLEGIGTPIALAMELPGLMALIERLLGGLPGAGAAHRELTDIERALARHAFESLVVDLSDTWFELLGVRLALDEVEVHGGSLQLGPPTEPTLFLTMELREGERSSTMSLVVPYVAIEPVVDRLPSGHVDKTGEIVQDERTSASLTSGLSAVDVGLRVEIASVDIPLERLLRIREGDVVSLESAAAAGVVVYAENVPLYRARPGRRGRNIAVEIAERLEVPS